MQFDKYTGYCISEGKTEFILCFVAYRDFMLGKIPEKNEENRSEF